ncbi:MAG TPA: adenosylcobinamide-phosphate synthase CbiB [Candidatus Aquilonibacter sp.]|nr:adenosylcobinamide-phosphate synthase CbiB [Candidatus Aquilonibacter sp.]
MEIDILRPHATLLAGAVLLDFLIGDPVYSAHPIRLIGRTLNWLEGLLRKLGADGYGGGIALFILLSTIWLGGTSAVLIGLQKWSHGAASFFHLFLAYSCLALHDLVRHAWAVETAARRGDLDGARTSISKLVGRDTDRMDIAACRRAAIESLSENLTDGFVSPLSWYVVAGLPGLVLFKVVSTMDSMVGYKTPRYLKFGWCGARLDDLMNFVPARITWLILTLFSFVIPGCSGRKAFRVGWQQHAILPGPNSGWSEAATAGGIQRRLLGPIWAKGALVTDVWLGDPSDPPAGADSDLPRAVILNVAAGVLSAALAILLALRI